MGCMWYIMCMLSYCQVLHDAGYNSFTCENLSVEYMQYIREDLHKLEAAQVCQLCSVFMVT